MTILTKTTSEKKAEKGVLPLFTATNSHDDAGPPPEFIEQMERRRRRFSYRLVLVLLLVALMVLCFGIIGGSILAKHFAKQPLERLRFHGYCSFPYMKDDLSSPALLYTNNQYAGANSKDIFSIIDDQESPGIRMPQTGGKYFREELDLDMRDEAGFAKIEVPDFRDDRSGRFLHDFKFNQSAIVDHLNRRCFIMPLDRNIVLPPESLYDLIEKMWNGHYDLNMDVVKKNMRVVIPALKNLTDISPRIVDECKEMHVYQLEKMVSGVFKRAADLEGHSKYAVFSGRLLEVDIHNMQDASEAEQRGY